MLTCAQISLEKVNDAAAESSKLLSFAPVPESPPAPCAQCAKFERSSSAGLRYTWGRRRYLGRGRQPTREAGFDASAASAARHWLRRRRVRRRIRWRMGWTVLRDGVDGRLSESQTC
ncbi:hypothetical protein VTO73DRAFT_10973 [Trametes versicolor]